ncbi:efflux RND transporter periplasmic adaptor subunit [Peptostreptococcus equinus]|uniref:Efflux RND transporter periplasmic adaptor subunit n=1 Tax=Peptostreptococcus equinus TaxID=3003601 RepID=A0ABY7JT98_9FIRM|nr:efflux RND transporter periplasmic adaptor subunit [Peptostreptococcus sp. CBA3647]WAW15704.1 efflux RND transporter periplasmic adaptor subunit [Peptostreptococcus sp. CBA3647]
MSFKDKCRLFIDKVKTDRKTQVIIGCLIISLFLVVGGLVVYNNLNQKPEQSVQTYTVPENEKVFINGIVVPRESKSIPAPSNGVTPDIRVSQGQTVKKDDVLYIVKDETAISEIANVKSQIDSLNRQRNTLKSDDPGLISINGQIASLNNTLSALNAKAYTKIKSPMDGKVYLNNNKNTSSLGEKSNLMAIQTVDYVMNGTLAEQDLSKIKLDMTANVTLLSTGEVVKGRVSYISERPTSSPSSAIADASQATGQASPSVSFYDVVLSFDTQEGIVDGYHTQATIEINTDKHKVPSSSIIKDNNEIYVFTDVDGILTKVNIEIVTEDENYATVTGKLNQNDIVIKNPTKNMKDGDTVPKIQNNSKDDKKSE